MKSDSIKSKVNSLSKREIAVLAASVLLIATIYLLSSYSTYAIGFPLDDSWIHQTYARNLTHGEWAFRPGITSAGSTSPLWSALLAVGFLLHLSPYIWTYFLGGAVLLMLGVICEVAARKLVLNYQPRYPFAGLFIIFEWHLAWASMSGMETLLHGLILTWVLVLLMTNSTRFLFLGVLSGIAVWIRPDGLTLLGPVLIMIGMTTGGIKMQLTRMVRLVVGFGSIFVPYVLLNLVIAGTPMPNTFYAKQAEYASWRELSLLTRLGQLSLQLLAGPGLVLVPGFILWIRKSIIYRKWGALVVSIWCLGYFLLYMSRLPMYQHGRYIMPAMPAFFLLGLLGTLDYMVEVGANQFRWGIKTAWLSGLFFLVIGFIFIGAISYADDVAVIESEMVATSKWVSNNLPPDAIIAAHDIGALGYFDNHKLVDLAGLISPEVIPFIRDERRLTDYLNQVKVDYLIAFPDFYPRMTTKLEPIHFSGGDAVVQFDQKNMVVYLWKRP